MAKVTINGHTESYWIALSKVKDLVIKNPILLKPSKSGELKSQIIELLQVKPRMADYYIAEVRTYFRELLENSPEENKRMILGYYELLIEACTKDNDKRTLSRVLNDLSKILGVQTENANINQSVKITYEYV